MARYYVNRSTQADGDHEVHRYGCVYMPSPEGWLYLGDFESCVPAIKKAKVVFEHCDGCYYCSTFCHARRGPIKTHRLVERRHARKITAPSL
ncbi:MAG TPA: hypothetical protein VGC50_14505 [Gammaproteobacteria bacterium]|jgi:hypothetical protein